jgi:hypothetical protein
MNILLSVLTVYLSIGFGVSLTITRVVLGASKDRSWKVVAFMFVAIMLLWTYILFAVDVGIATLSTMPTAELIHCKDCKHWICHDRRCGYWNHGVKLLDWCCHAGRSTNEVRTQ